MRHDTATKGDLETVLRLTLEQEHETAKCELSFVGETKIVAGKIDDAWWCPPTIDDSSIGSNSAQWILGSVYGLQFVSYLRSNQSDYNRVSEDLARIVEAMTGASLGIIEKGFMMAICEAIMGRQTVLASTDKGGNVLAVACGDDEAKSAGVN